MSGLRVVIVVATIAMVAGCTSDAPEPDTTSIDATIADGVKHAASGAGVRGGASPR